MVTGCGLCTIPSGRLRGLRQHQKRISRHRKVHNSVRDKWMSLGVYRSSHTTKIHPAYRHTVRSEHIHDPCSWKHYGYHDSIRAWQPRARPAPFSFSNWRQAKVLVCAARGGKGGCGMHNHAFIEATAVIKYAGNHDNIPQLAQRWAGGAGPLPLLGLGPLGVAP